MTARAELLATQVGSITLPNPIMTASGTSGHGTELAEYGDLSVLGAVVVKSLSVNPWPGNPSPRVHEVGTGMLNSVGLQGPGLAAWLEQELPDLTAAGARVVVSIWGQSVSEYGRAASMLAQAVRDDTAMVAVEVNVSCPNVEDRSRMFAHSAKATEQVLAATECGLPRRAHLDKYPAWPGPRPEHPPPGAGRWGRRVVGRRRASGGRTRGVGVPGRFS
jgi:dihydroorotate dehydrogenase (NAD+) catalytic subunit